MKSAAVSLVNWTRTQTEILQMRLTLMQTDSQMMNEQGDLPARYVPSNRDKRIGLYCAILMFQAICLLAV